MAKKYWLMKSEPGEFSIDDLKSAPNGTEHWDGVRNYQARNFLRDEIKGMRLSIQPVTKKQFDIVASMGAG